MMAVDSLALSTVELWADQVVSAFIFLVVVGYRLYSLQFNRECDDDMELIKTLHPSGIHEKKW